MCISMLFYFLVLSYFITFTLKCFALAVAAVSAELRAILLNKTCKTLQFLCPFVSSALDGQFCARWSSLLKILLAHNRRILTSLDMFCFITGKYSTFQFIMFCRLILPVLMLILFAMRTHYVIFATCV